MIRIGIICEQEQDRKTISSLLSFQRDFHIASIGKSGYDALRSAAELRPDIIVMEHLLAGIQSTELAPVIKRKSPGTKLIVFNSCDNAGWIGQALQSGISGLLIKQLDMDKLTTAIKTVFYGGYYFSASIKSHVSTVLSVNTTRAALSPRACLVLSDASPTERKIINDLALGYTDKEIADDLRIAAGTVRNSMNDLKRRAGLKSRIQVIAYALLCGLITEPL